VQLSEAAKANTTIGTPLFMSPEVLEGAEYDSQADIWSLAITAIQMAEGFPPHFKENVMRAMLLISTGPAPKLTDEAKWSGDFHNFLGVCLQRDPAHRPTATALLEHPFIKKGTSDYHSLIRSWMDRAKAKADAEKADKDAAKASSSSASSSTTSSVASSAAGKKPPPKDTPKKVGKESLYPVVCVCVCVCMRVLSCVV
jgi:serine/threonine kinase 4